jgi:DNA polymerase III subunit beta
MAIATIPFSPRGSPIDALVPAVLVAEVGKRVAGECEVTPHADRNSFSLSWRRSTATTAILGGTFVSKGNVQLSTVDTRVEVDADALLAAVRPFAGGEVHIAVQPGVRATLLAAVDPGEVRIKYLLVPLSPPQS